MIIILSDYLFIFYILSDNLIYSYLLFEYSDNYYISIYIIRLFYLLSEYSDFNINILIFLNYLEF